MYTVQCTFYYTIIDPISANMLHFSRSKSFYVVLEKSNKNNNTLLSNFTKNFGAHKFLFGIKLRERNSDVNHSFESTFTELM